MTSPHSQKIFAFYGRTRTPMLARSTEAVQERARQLSVATELVDSVSGRIALTFFDTSSHPLDALRHRKQARRLLHALADPNRPFDAVVVGDTRITMSARQFDEFTQLCSVHNVELWCPEIAGAYELGNARHDEIMWRLFWDPHDVSRPRRQAAAGAPLPVGEPPLT